MRGEIDPIDFILAEQLGCTLGEIGALPAREVELWRGWRTVRAALSEIQR